MTKIVTRHDVSTLRTAHDDLMAKVAKITASRLANAFAHRLRQLANEEAHSAPLAAANPRSSARTKL